MRSRRTRPMNYALDPDVALMLAFQKGDEQAYAQLVERFQGIVINAIYRYVGDRAEAEDLSQDVFVRVFNARRTYEPQAKFTTWLFRIVTNMCLNEIRDRGRHKILSLAPDEVLTQQPDRREPEDGPLHALGQAELRTRIKAAIDELPNTQRMAILLDKYQDCSYEEIAEHMKLSTMAVKSLLSRARENLRKRLAPLIQREVS